MNSTPDHLESRGVANTVGASVGAAASTGVAMGLAALLPLSIATVPLAPLVGAVLGVAVREYARRKQQEEST